MKRMAAGLLLLGLVLAALALWSPGKDTQDLVLAEGDCERVDAHLALELESFTVPRYASGLPRQYVSAVRVMDDSRHDLRSAEISVNHPLRVGGWWIFQYAYGPDECGVECTQLRCVKDPFLWAAAVGGLLVFVGSLLLAWSRHVDFKALSHTLYPPPSVPRPLKTALAWLAAVTVVALPVFIIGRAVMRPEPVPALQSWLMAPHVAAYSASYLMLLFAAFGIGRRFVPLGFVLMTCGLIIGALWGKIAWSEWWQFDPKENWSFVTWLAFASALHFPPGSRAARWLLRLGAVLIVITLTWVNFSRFASGLHSYAVCTLADPGRAREMPQPCKSACVRLTRRREV